ncbi:MAG: hydrogenase/urease maturation nickel metallochaperone HypA [candidate division WOR-3 bacterium]|nr:hydrogenase/urease maturation nickel metallochaperone HypA [candidate division WOR-3 bacterium]MCX7837524.1 hydrogenase/urease maturation nickel metallochaperone HypA [candidate division WOR-3 bacterium]MDW8113836.1 hydrogenase/urease maturation nickel metallochaperone HypA [candidate division WOR-3 bacterium]
MHEFSCAQYLIKVIHQVCEKYEIKKIYKISIKIGTLTLINKEQFLFWLKEGLKDSLMENSEIEAIEEKPEIECKDCGYYGEIKEEFSYICPKCNSFKILFKKGDNYYLESIEGE